MDCFKSFFRRYYEWAWMLVALAGFEPAIPVPKAGVLPLDHSAEYNKKKRQRVSSTSYAYGVVQLSDHMSCNDFKPIVSCPPGPCLYCSSGFLV